jgi:solute carrier family 45 protein 1/2/4
MSAVGHIIGYGGGAVDLVKVLGPTLGDTQFKQLSVIAVVTILVTTGVTCWAVTERVLVDNDASKKDGSRFKVVKQIYSTLLHLPPRIQAICWAQFWQWIGWFPFLFYSTTWVGETYFRYDAPDTGKSDDVLGDMGRIGSQAFVIYSLITFTGAIVFPMLVQSPEDENFTPRPPAAIAGLVRHFSWSKPDLLSTWIFGQLLFAVTMSMAPFATTFRFATALVCICGV